ncbi:peptidase domain-containing ABC transporter [Flavobacterium sp.]|jgi:ABC-type bacteriocin/lantibiotic exporter with double-glycine peptidase domain|uniref:peptidase domain-containing ABC transporter n=1 Tax=Flavobacterium sp. TaxID=239 RepID=UPI002A815341|nr:ATP-binding cassette domain-containing protein [Flavobacterium sp.]
MSPIERFKNLIIVDKKDVYQLLIYAVLAGLISLSIPLGIQSIINFIQAGQVSTSWIVLVFIVVLGVAFVGILKIMQFRITENIQQKIFVRSSFEFAYRFPKIKFNQIYNYSPPELANRFFDTLTVQKGFSKLILEVSTAALQIIFGILLLSLYHPFFIFFGIILLVILYFIFKINFNSGLETSLKESKYKYKVAHWLQEIARNHLSFKNGKLFDFSLNKNDILVNEYLSHRESHFKVLRKQFIQLTGFKVLITAGLLVIGGILVLNQQMNIGQFVAAEIIIITIITAVEKLFYGLELFYDVTTSLEKLGTVVDLELENRLENTTSNYYLEDENICMEAKEISFQFPDSDSAVIKNINLTLNNGDRMLIQGENGSGKTTLLRLLARLLEPSTGSIFLNDTNIKKYCIDEFRNNIGVITIDDSPFEGTIYENITCNNPEISKKEVAQLLEKLKLTDLIKSLPLGLDTLMISEGKRINSASTQKILLARCLITKPKLLFLEEPVEKLDKYTAGEIIDFLTAPENPWTLVVIAKGNYWKEKCTKIITLENNTIKSIK